MQRRRRPPFDLIVDQTGGLALVTDGDATDWLLVRTDGDRPGPVEPDRNGRLAWPVRGPDDPGGAYDLYIPGFPRAFRIDTRVGARDRRGG